MPLRKDCDRDAIGDNVKRLRREGKPQKQAIAIALSILRKACGMKEERPERSGAVAVSLAHLPSRKKLRKKKQVDEEGFGLAGPPKIYNPHRVPPTTRDKKPIHRKFKKNVRSQVFIDPEDFGLQYIPVESLFRETSPVHPGFKLTTNPQGPGHGVGTSPSASTTKKPTDRKRKKVRVAPTKGKS